MGRKSKFTLEERVSVCKDYLEMRLSRKDIQIKYSVSKCEFYRYINRFRIHGIEGLKKVEPIFYLAPCINVTLIFLILLLTPQF